MQHSQQANLINLMTKRLYFAVNKVNKVRFGEVSEVTKVEIKK